tara:strand:+ start:26556 stop:27455 length:900 start_codon:yes stop_codon:yes gene_type:complete
MNKILLFSSLKKPKDVIDLAISSWIALTRSDEMSIDILIYDDGYDKNSSELISNFKNQNKIKTADFEINQRDNYQGDHQWNTQQIDKISQIKNKAIEYALQNSYDYLFLVDADLVLNPNTLAHLVSQKKDFVFEVFWTLFYGESYYKPNAWDFHSWNYYNEETILMLSKPGTYKVGGGGACTLLTREILKNGLNFDRLESLKYNGEDRHFCTRAQALGFSVYVDTHYPAYHIFNFDQTEEARDWYRNGAPQEFFDSWLSDTWKNKVIKSFKVNKSFIGALKRFQYKFRKDFVKLMTGKY